MDERQDWRGLYREGWGQEIVPEAFAHPAKFSRGLIRHIYQHAVEERWLQYGDVVLDPFGGVALGSLDAMRHGLRWIGVELEQKFVDLGSQNISKWMREYAPHFPDWGSAQLLQGDSRNLLAVIGEAAGVVSSPPYAETPIEQTHMTSNKRGNPDNPGYRPSWKKKLAEGYANTKRPYGSTPGQLGAMRAGGLDAAVSSPPYAESMGNADSSGIDWGKQADRDTVHPHGWDGERYGSTPGQLGAMRAGGLDAAVSSPPYEGTLIGSGSDSTRKRIKNGKYKGLRPDVFTSKKNIAGSTFGDNYSDDPNNLGSTTGSDFWSAARAIVDQVYAALRPGGCAIWVVKAFVKNGERVDFPDQWRQMCEAAGFETLHQHRAWLVEQRGAQFDLNGDLVEKRVERKSFFRRLAEAKAQAAMYWLDLSRQEKTRYLMQSHRELWDDYNRRMAEPYDPEIDPPIFVTRRRIIDVAQMAAWVEADKPWMDIDTRIDFEMVLCQRKPLPLPTAADADRGVDRCR